MKRYKYSGTCNLAFTFKGKDYIIYGNGPHKLPEKAPIIQTLILRSILKEAELVNKKIKV